MRTEHEQTAVEEEGGDAGDAERLRVVRRSTYLALVGVAVDHRAGTPLVQAGLDHKRKQFVTITDVARLFPVPAHKPVMHLLVQATFTRELGHTKRAQRVRDDLGRRVVDKTRSGKALPKSLMEAFAIARMQLRAENALGRILGVKIERQPGHVRAEPAREPLGRRLAEAGERSDVI